MIFPLGSQKYEIFPLIYQLLHEIFHKIASLWMKHRAKSTDDGRSELFKFRSRTFKMESILKIDVSNCANLLANDSFSEWQELLSEELDDKVMILFLRSILSSLHAGGHRKCQFVTEHQLMS